MGTALLVAAIVVGSRNLENFDPALVIYTFAVIFATWGIVYHYAVWLNKPPTRRYFDRTFQLFGTLGTATGSFTNIQLHVDTSRPVLAVRTAGAGQIQLRWLTNFNWYVPEIATSISAVTWEPVTNSPTVQSNQFVIQLGVQPGPNFFRLRQD